MADTVMQILSDDCAQLEAVSSLHRNAPLSTVTVVSVPPSSSDPLLATKLLDNSTKTQDQTEAVTERDQTEAIAERELDNEHMTASHDVNASWCPSQLTPVPEQALVWKLWQGAVPELQKRRG